MRIEQRLVPLAGDLPRARARALAALVWVAAAAVSAQLVLFAAGVSASGVAAALEFVTIAAGSTGVVARLRWRPDDSQVWRVFALALALMIAASAYAGIAFGGGERQSPSPADALTLLAYVVAYAGIVMLLRSRARGVPASLWLDGLIGALCIAAIGCAFLFEPVLREATGSTAETITNLAYPVGDSVMLALVIGSFALAGWRPGREWSLIGAALIALSIGDAIFLRQTLGNPGAPLTPLVALLWTQPAALLMLAAWQRPPHNELRVSGWPVVVVPGAFSLAALGLLIYGNLERIGPLALALAGAALVAAMGRTLLTLREVWGLAESLRQARTDELTGLPNRRALQAELDALSAADTGERALVLLDLDGFKELNDTLGHQAGDHVLEQVGSRLSSAVRPGDFLARLGGDEFAVLVRGIDHEAAGLGAGEKLLSAVRRDFVLPEMSVHVEASAGVALFGRDASSGEELLQRADVAMYRAKAERCGCRLYESALDVHSRDRLELSGQLREAIARRALLLHYQPKASMANAEVVGVEALARWDHPQRGLIPPGEFIPLAERAGLMGPLTAAVLDQALGAMAGWRREHPHLTVAVNVAAANLLDRGFPGTVERLLAAHRVDPGLVVLEITENSVMTDPERGRAVLDALHGIGVQLSLDDFGTGYSSLSYLTLLPVDELKIDRSFVAGLLTEHGNEAIVSVVVELARNLGLRIVAEGIEDEATWERVRGHGCHEAQGFLFARPMPLEQLLGWLAERRGAVSSAPERQGARARLLGGQPPAVSPEFP